MFWGAGRDSPAQTNQVSDRLWRLLKWLAGIKMNGNPKLVCWLAVFSAGLILLPAVVALGEEASSYSSTVGVAEVIEDLVLPGAPVGAAPIADRKQPVVVRLLETRPHGTAHRYTIEFTGFETGGFDLRDYLRRADGSPLDDLPRIPVTITALLPPDRMEPDGLEQQATSWLRSYRWLLAGGALLWFAVLLALLRKSRRSEVEEEIETTESLAQRLAPLIEEARRGELTDAKRAELERLVLAWCRQRMNLADADAADAMQQLRKDAQMEKIVHHLEAWLHAPRSGEYETTDGESNARAWLDLLEKMLTAGDPTPVESEEQLADVSGP